MADRSFLSLAVFRGSPSRTGREPGRVVREEPAGGAWRCRRRLPRAGGQARQGRLAEADSDRHRQIPGRSTCARSASPARRWRGMTGSPTSPSPCRGSAPARSACSARPEQQNWLAKTRAGKAISAFALSEPRSGSDVANMDMTAARDGDSYVLTGEKTWISNGGIADFYVVFARTGEAPGAKGLSAFLVPADSAGLTIAERLEVIAPHPLARLVLRRRARAGIRLDRQARRRF